MRLETIFSGHAQRRPGHPAVICGDARVGYGALQAAMRRLASGLAALGVKPDDRVLIYLPNGVEFIIAEYAVFMLGAIAVPVNTRLTANEITHIFADAQPVAALYHAGGRDAVRPGLRNIEGCRALVLGQAEADEISLDRLLAAPADLLPESPLPEVPCQQEACMILYTSGTTGQPKGAVITHANMVVQNLLMHGLEWRLSRDDRFLVMTPLAHRAGISRLFNALGLGGTLVIAAEKFDPLATLELIARERITAAGLVPTVIRMLLPHLRDNPASCASLRLITVATEAFPVPLKRELLALLPHAEIHSLFGSTETLVTNLSHAEQFTHPASVGRPIPGVEVRFVDDTGKDVPAGEVGEMAVRCGVPGRYATIAEYFRRPEETVAAVRNGWFHTGDMGRQDIDGYVYIVDRKKDMVISGGFNIYSKEVEQVLQMHPGVAEAAVIGVPDEIWGEAVAVFVVRRPGATLDASCVIEHCKAHLAGYKKPKHVFFVDSLPKNSIGKVLKTDLRSDAAKRLNPVRLNSS
ncbi:MAG: long-chain fatty acid--CoA ligase [Betaproteobacteria bacterium]|nr:long-chain fatty acid--CoA ligase [Betaproteobacteria bacterium]